MPPRVKTAVSIVICSYGRPDSLNDTLQSLSRQTFKDFEVILILEKGNLASLRDQGLRAAAGDVVCFIDDDVYCPETWLGSVVEIFRKPEVVGVTGPTTITKDYERNRDCLKFRTIKKLHDFVFKVSKKPGHLSPCGAPSMASNLQDCSSYDGPVEYLECCNMSVKKKEALDAGGFDNHYQFTGEWSEVDLALKMRASGGLCYSGRALLYHRPSSKGIYSARLSTAHRLENFKRFQRKWVKPSLRRHLYWGFIWTYFTLKQLRTI